MPTNSSGRVPTVAATHRDAGKEALAHMSRGESQAMLQSLLLELSVKISHSFAHLQASSRDPAQSSDDLTALIWIQRSLEDIEATIIGLSEMNHHGSAALPSLAPSSAGRLVS